MVAGGRTSGRKQRSCLRLVLELACRKGALSLSARALDLGMMGKVFSLVAVGGGGKRRETLPGRMVLGSAAWGKGDCSD